MDERSARAAELERKKQRLAEMRQQKRRAEDERRQTLLAAPASNGGTTSPARATLTEDELQNILVEVGVDPTPQINRTPPRGTLSDRETNGTVSPRGMQRIASSGARVISLDFTEPQTVSAAPRENASYAKTTQTDDDKASFGGEFSHTGSQEFDYDDDMLPIDRHDVHIAGSPTDDLAHYLPLYAGRIVATADDDAAAKRAAEEEREKAAQKLPDLSEEEKNQIVSSATFLTFFDYTSKVMLRALNEDDIFVNYAIDVREHEKVSGERLTLTRTLEEEKWTAGRPVVGMSFSEQHPELVAVAYDELPEVTGEPNGVVVVWNIKFKKPMPEYVFYCYSRLTSVAFAKFHPHLIIGGCYSGQLVLWDSRQAAVKKTPISKSPLLISAHTHPVYSLAVVGSSNAHSVVSVSTDGKLCAWNTETLSSPIEARELIGRPTKPTVPRASLSTSHAVGQDAGASRPYPENNAPLGLLMLPFQYGVAALCMAFPPNEVNALVVAGEDGAAYFFARHGTSTADKIFDGHSAPVTGVSFHPSGGPIDFSHIFLTASADWTIKLWSTKENKLRLSLEAHADYVYDVAWSPIHPAVFASIDMEGNLFLWNLAEDIEGPVARYQLSEEEATPTAVRKIVWSANGQHLLVGGANGAVLFYDVHECMYNNVRPDEWSKFAGVLAELRQAFEEAEESNDGGSSIGGVGRMGSTIGTMPLGSSAGLVGGGSPRSAY